MSQIYIEIRRSLMRLVRRWVDDPVEVEDLVQQVYLKSFESSRDRTIDDPKAYMKTAARNLALNHLQSAGLRAQLFISDDVDGQSEIVSSPEGKAELNERFLLFCKAVERLPSQCRRVFILKQVYGFSQKEIASRLGVSEKTVEYHVAKGLLLCRQYLARIDMDSDPAFGTLRRMKDGQKNG